MFFTDISWIKFFRTIFFFKKYSEYDYKYVLKNNIFGKILQIAKVRNFIFLHFLHKNHWNFKVYTFRFVENILKHILFQNLFLAIFRTSFEKEYFTQRSRNISHKDDVKKIRKKFKKNFLRLLDTLYKYATQTFYLKKLKNKNKHTAGQYGEDAKLLWFSQQRNSRNIKSVILHLVRNCIGIFFYFFIFNRKYHL